MWPFGKKTDQRLKEALQENVVLSKYNLDFKINKKTAVFTGDVPFEGHKNLIKVVAEGINGVDKVDLSAVTVTPPAAEAAAEPVAVIDTTQAQAAQQKILADTELAKDPLDVIQKGNTVVLRGAVSSQAEFEKAKELASSAVSGVTIDTSGLQVIENASKLNDTDDDGDIVYTVKSGDTLSHIALHYYGSAGRASYMKIAEANGIDNPNLIRVGQQLKIPGTTQGPEANLA